MRAYAALTMRWMHRVRLYPTSSQQRRLAFMLHITRTLYNAALQERRDAYRLRGVLVTAKMQYAELTSLRHDEPGMASVYRECQDAVLHRLELAMQAFFRRIKRGETPGYPRFRSAARWSQLEFPHGDRALKLDPAQTKVRIPGVGSVRLRKGRAVPTFGRAFLVAKNERWYAVFECDRDVKPLPATGNVVGIDCGVRVLAATSEGELIVNPRHADRRRVKVELHNRALAASTVRGEGPCFECVRCGHQDDADVNAARNILARAVQSAPMSELSPGDARLAQHDAA